MSTEKPLTGPTSAIYRTYHQFVLDLTKKMWGFDLPNISSQSTWSSDPLKQFLGLFLDDHHLQDTSPLLQVIMSILITSTLFFGIIIALLFPSFWQVAFGLSCLMTFHLLEYCMLAVHQTDTARINYANFGVWLKPVLIYHAVMIEFCIWSGVSYYNGWETTGPYWGKYRFISYIGIVLLCIGQFFRSLSMWQCGYNFQYTLRDQKDNQNHLVTSGIFSTMRHPSYAAMIMYSIGFITTLQAPVMAFWLIVSNYPLLIARIELEEEKLVNMYGEQYHKYRQTTPAVVPNGNIFKLSTYI